MNKCCYICRLWAESRITEKLKEWVMIDHMIVVKKQSMPN